MLFAHLVVSFRSDASLYLFQRCSLCNGLACSSCSFISFLHALTPAQHSGSDSALGLSIPAFHAARNMLPPELLGWEFQFLVLISGTPIISRIPIPFLISKIPVGIILLKFQCLESQKIKIPIPKFRILVIILCV
jgi:hypothetical protein